MKNTLNSFEPIGQRDRELRIIELLETIVKELRTPNASKSTKTVSQARMPKANK
jgi:hypothetical protein